MTVRQGLPAAEERLARAGIDTPRLDAELLLAHALGVTRTQLFAAPELEAPAGFEPLLARREAREPLAYVLGEWGFRRLMLTTDRCRSRQRATRVVPPPCMPRTKIGRSSGTSSTEARCRLSERRQRSRRLRLPGRA